MHRHFNNIVRDVVLGGGFQSREPLDWFKFLLLDQHTEVCF